MPYAIRHCCLTIRRPARPTSWNGRSCGSAAPFGRPALWPGLAANIAWFLAFALHHSLFARERVKGWVARHVPDRLLRSFYVWIASLLWFGVVAAWQPLGGLLFEQTGANASCSTAAAVRTQGFQRELGCLQLLNVEM